MMKGCSIKQHNRGIKEFDRCSERSMRHKVLDLYSSYTYISINAADSSTILEEINTAGDPDNTLARITQVMLSRYQYQVKRNESENMTHHILPSK